MTGVWDESAPTHVAAAAVAVLAEARDACPCPGVAVLLRAIAQDAAFDTQTVLRRRDVKVALSTFVPPATPDGPINAYGLMRAFAFHLRRRPPAETRADPRAPLYTPASAKGVPCATGDTTVGGTLALPSGGFVAVTSIDRSPKDPGLNYVVLPPGSLPHSRPAAAPRKFKHAVALVRPPPKMALHAGVASSPTLLVALERVPVPATSRNSNDGWTLALVDVAAPDLRIPLLDQTTTKHVSHTSPSVAHRDDVRLFVTDARLWIQWVPRNSSVAHVDVVSFPSTMPVGTKPVGRALFHTAAVSHQALGPQAGAIDAVLPVPPDVDLGGAAVPVDPWLGVDTARTSLPDPAGEEAPRRQAAHPSVVAVSAREVTATTQALKMWPLGGRPTAWEQVQVVPVGACVGRCVYQMARFPDGRLLASCTTGLVLLDFWRHYRRHKAAVAFAANDRATRPQVP